MRILPLKEVRQRSVWKRIIDGREGNRDRNDHLFQSAMSTSGPPALVTVREQGEERPFVPISNEYVWSLSPCNSQTSQKERQKVDVGGCKQVHIWRAPNGDKVRETNWGEETNRLTMSYPKVV